MGHPALDFRSAQNSNKQFSSPEEEEMSELLQFLEKPQSIGLNNVKESLRNTVLLMMAMSGLDTGYRYTPIMGDDYGGLSLDGNAEFQRKKKKKKKLLWDQLLEMERLLAENFNKLFERTLSLITDVKKEINQKIQVLDRMIETNKEDGFFSQEDLSDAKQELRDLRNLQTEIESLETDLKKTNNSLDVINIEKKLDDKISNVKTPSAPQKNEFLDLLKKSIDKKKADHMAAAAATASAADEPATAPDAPDTPSSHSADHAEFSPSGESHTDTVADAPAADSASAADADTADSTSDAGTSASHDGHTDFSEMVDHADAEAATECSNENDHTTPDATTISDGDTSSDDDGDDGEHDEEDDLEPPAPLV